jgi:hypothetical protein
LEVFEVYDILGVTYETLLEFVRSHLELITALYEMKHQYSPDSAPTVFFPSLEVFEVYDILGVTYENPFGIHC